MKKILLFLILIYASCSLFARSIRQPTMPQGLTADKKKPQKLPQKKEPIERPKPKRKGLQGYRKYHTLSQMDYDELMEAKNKTRDAKNWDTSIKYLERLITVCDTINEKAVLIIELADILFNQQKYDDAAKWYMEFSQLYPGNEHIEYASYKAVVCASKKIVGYDRDQLPTEKTLELTNAFLARSDLFTTYKKDVITIQKHCYHMLAQSDCNVATFYLKQGNYTAAQRRLKTIRNEWIDKAPGVAPLLAHLEIDLGAQFSDFKVPEDSIKLARAVNPSKKTDMTLRF